MDLTTDSIMYCSTCKEYVVIDVDEKNTRDYKCVKCQSRLEQVLDN
jgi:DNA-directed RNA polymerase subunit RPC12/RpoP